MSRGVSAVAFPMEIIIIVSTFVPAGLVHGDLQAHQIDATILKQAGASSDLWRARYDLPLARHPAGCRTIRASSFLALARWLTTRLLQCVEDARRTSLRHGSESRPHQLRPMTAGGRCRHSLAQFPRADRRDRQRAIPICI